MRATFGNSFAPAGARRRNAEAANAPVGSRSPRSQRASVASRIFRSVLRANLVQTCHGKPLPVVARSAGTLDAFSNGYVALLLLAARLGGFEPRRPRQFLNGFWPLVLALEMQRIPQVL